jgi:isopentenyl diphosphate isomerase/L-lactate dehydrogenase-like FMN-dependent dehydrogenase
MAEAPADTEVIEWSPVVRTSVSPGIAPTPIASDDELRESIQTLQELIPRARANLAKEHWDYLVGGSETEVTVRRNRMAIETLALRPRVLRKLTQIDLGTTLFGIPLSLPLILAPIGGLEAFDPAGAAAAASAAAKAGVMMCLSSACQPGPRETAAAAPPGSPKIFQLYVRGDRDFIAKNVQTAIDCGYQVFCLTVDTQLYSRRERDMLNRFAKPWRKGADDAATNQSASQASLDWDDVEWVRVLQFSEGTSTAWYILAPVSTRRAREALAHTTICSPLLCRVVQKDLAKSTIGLKGHCNCRRCRTCDAAWCELCLG